MNSKSLKLRLETIYLAIYGSLACIYPFLAVYFKDRGLSYVETGIAFGATSLVSIIAQPLWGYITDKYLSKKKTLLLCSAGAALAIFLFVIAHSFYFVLLAIAATLFFQCALTPISDAYTYEIIEEHRSIQFGKIRLMGSISYAVVALILGKIIQATDINIGFYLYSVFLIFCIVLLYGIHFEGRESAARPSLADVVDVLKNYRFVLFMVSVMLVSAAFGANNSYIPILIEKTGGNIANIGLLWFVTAMSELPAFFFGNKLVKRWGELNIFLIAVFFYIIRLFLSSISPNYMIAILIQLMQGITFPLYIIGSLQYTNILVPSRIRASGLTLLSSLGFGLGGFIGNLGGGVVLKYMSIFYLYRLLAVICMISLAVGFVLKVRDRKMGIGE